MKKKEEKQMYMVLAGLIVLASSIFLFAAFKKPKIDLSKSVNDDGVVRLLFIGSSSTAGSDSYADYLKELWPEIEITKVAEVGVQTGWMLENAIGLIQTVSYDAIIIFGGLNDIYATGSVSSAKSNLQSIYNAANDNGAITIGITLQPTHYYESYTDAKGTLTVDLNSWISKNTSLDYVIDLFSMTSINGIQDTTFFQPDNLHLITYTHQLLAGEIDNKVFI